MHEMVDELNTEEALKNSCVKVGEHLYVRRGSEIGVGDFEKDFQIVFSMGGSGTRLQHITKDKYSKHVIEVRGKPISRYVFDLWVKNGFTDVCILTDDTHRGESVTDHYKNGEKLGADIKYSIEHTKLGSGGAFKLAIENNVITKSFINHYPDDIIVNYPNFPKDFAKVFTAALKAGYECVIVCAPGRLYPYGVVEDQNGKVVDFIEKPFIEKDTNTGIFGMSERVFPTIKELGNDKEVKVERSVFKELAESGKMFKVLIPTEYWIPINDEMNLKRFVEISK